MKKIVSGKRICSEAKLYAEAVEAHIDAMRPLESAQQKALARWAEGESLSPEEYGFLRKHNKAVAALNFP